MNVSQKKDILFNNIKLKPFNQIAYAVYDIKKSLSFFMYKYGLRNWYKSKNNIKFEISYNGKKSIVENIEHYASFIGKIQIEILHIKKGTFFYSESLTKIGNGIHHYGFVVNNLEEKIKFLNNNNIDYIEFRRIDEKNNTSKPNVIFLDTFEEIGAYTELMETKAFGININGTSKFIYNMALILGELKKVKLKEGNI